MFYRQCNDCNERWEIGEASTCRCDQADSVTDKDAMKLALEAFEKSLEAFEKAMAITMAPNDLRNKAIEALRQAIAQAEQEAEQEPVAWRYKLPPITHARGDG